MPHKFRTRIPITCSQARQIALADSHQTLQSSLADVLRQRVNRDANPMVQRHAISLLKNFG